MGRWAQISRSEISILLWGFITLSCQNSTQHSHLTHFVCRNLSCLSASWSTFIYLLMLSVKSLDIHFKLRKALKVKYPWVPCSIIKNLTNSVLDTGSDQQREFICGKAQLTCTLMSIMHTSKFDKMTHLKRGHFLIWLFYLFVIMSLKTCAVYWSLFCATQKKNFKNISSNLQHSLKCFFPLHTEESYHAWHEGE